MIGSRPGLSPGRIFLPTGKGKRAVRRLDVGNQLMGAPITWRSRAGVLSPRRPPGVWRSPNSSVTSMTDPSRAHADAANLFTAPLAETDPEVADVIRRELGRHRDEIELIASENIVSKADPAPPGPLPPNNDPQG